MSFELTLRSACRKSGVAVPESIIHVPTVIEEQLENLGGFRPPRNCKRGRAHFGTLLDVQASRLKTLGWRLAICPVPKAHVTHDTELDVATLSKATFKLKLTLSG